MYTFFKKIYFLLPRPFKRVVLKCYEDYFRSWSFRQTGKKPQFFLLHSKNSKPRLLFYFISGLSYGGTSKMLQVFAKHLNFSKYEVYYMYSSKPRSISGDDKTEAGREYYFQNTLINLIEFNYDSIDGKYPFIIREMQPNLLNMIKKFNIDLLVTTSSGYTEFPFNLVTDLPILNFNIFGAPAVQQNIYKHICISKEVAFRIKGIVNPPQIEVLCIPSGNPPLESKGWGQDLRRSLGFTNKEIVFGRIGRAVDSIFDPIGIKAFQQVVKKYPQAYFLIMAPPPILKKIVADEKIPNVSFLPASGEEKDIWGFHQAVDVLAHFRHDGESFGLNIAESMLCGKPIISHRSHYWNAHLEYLDSSFSRIAEIDAINQYAGFLEEFVVMSDFQRQTMGELARKKAERLFLIENNIKQFEKIIDETLVYAYKK